MSTWDNTALVRRRRARHRRPGWSGLAIAVVLTLALMAGGAVYGAYVIFQRAFPATLSGIAGEPGERINVLFIGVDGGINGGAPGSNTARADVTVLVSFDPMTGEAAALQLPRDTRVLIPRRTGFSKLGHAHAYGGPLLAVETVAGFLDVKVHYYVRVDFAAFIRAVDILGGVEITVPRDMYYVDPAQDLYIDIKAGRQVMDGETALDFVRYRSYPNGDIGRIQAQQTLARAFVSKFYELDILWRLPSLAQAILPYLETNMDASTMLQLARQALHVREEGIAMELLPGSPRDVTEGGRVTSYWVADPVRTRRLVDLLIRGIDYDANGRVRVEVLNGSGSERDVARVVAHLRRLGYTVVRTGMADRQTHERTQLISYSTDRLTVGRMTRAVSELAGQPRVITRRPPAEPVDFTIVVGADARRRE
jgi:LCP family protein required for cell wall assembly